MTLGKEPKMVEAQTAVKKLPTLAMTDEAAKMFGDRLSGFDEALATINRKLDDVTDEGWKTSNELTKAGASDVAKEVARQLNMIILSGLSIILGDDSPFDYNMLDNIEQLKLRDVVESTTKASTDMLNANIEFALDSPKEYKFISNLISNVNNPADREFIRVAMEISKISKKNFVKKITTTGGDNKELVLAPMRLRVFQQTPEGEEVDKAIAERKNKQGDAFAYLEEE